MEVIHFAFFAVKSLELKSIDLGYKICLRKPTWYTTFAIPKIRLFIGFLDSDAFSVQSARSLAGFAEQVFLSKALLSSKFFGLKNSVSTIRFWQINFSEVLKYFWLYCPDLIVSKFITLGVRGTRFKYLRFLVFDIFNFFGGEFYQLFYLNYFDFAGFLVTDFSWGSEPLFLNGGFNCIDTQLAHIRTFFTFFKCLLKAIRVYLF